ncbi:L-cystine transporter [Lacrimispora sp.]|jgi:L-cystine uptake protein TcyP (sodium:dicarboxylate symporter family)|uniref:L-cystine transporter n=1 Tax=Lacrimispora sp. TaxID=2719234 RepID=UPI0028A6AB4A|nr:L-cystine transporter [Lacrimispora sp.]
MDLLWTLVTIAVILMLAGILYYMQKKHISFSKRVFSALLMGIVAGSILQISFASDGPILATSLDWISIIGTGYVNLLKMIVIPLIMVSIISATVNLKSHKSLGKISTYVLATLLLTVFISSLVGIATANIFHLTAEEITVGQAETDRAEYLEGKVTTVQEQTIPQQILSFIPQNPFQDMTGDRATSTIAVVIFSAFLGISALGIQKKKPEEAETFLKIINSLYAVVMRMVTLILRLTPYGILALMTKTIATTNTAGIIALSKFVIANYAALIVMFAIHLLIILLMKLNPVTYIKKAFPTLTIAFTSRSSAGTLPLTIETQTKKLGIPDGIANFAASFGTTIGQNGCAGVYPAMLAVMIAPVVGINPMSIGFIAKLSIIVTISSFGIAGVGGGATFAALMVLSAMNLPVGLAGLLISVEPLIDMGRTALNVNDAMLAGLVTAKMTSELDVNLYDAPVDEDTAVSL